MDEGGRDGEGMEKGSRREGREKGWRWDGDGMEKVWRRDKERDGFIKCFDFYEIHFTDPWIIQSSMVHLSLRSNNLCSSITTFQEISPSTTKVQPGFGANQN